MSRAEREDPDDLIEEFLNAKQGTVTETHFNALRRTTKYYREWLQTEGLEPEEVTPSDINNFVNFLMEERGNDDNTVENRLRKVKTLYKYWERRGVVEIDPVGRAKEDNLLAHNPGEKDLPLIPLSEFSEFVQSVRDPWKKAPLVLMAKTGARSSEVANLDLRDVNIAYEPVREFYDEQGAKVRDELTERPDTLYIPSGINQNEEYNGEVRETGNKRSTDTYIPLDSELKGALIEWLACRPTTKYRNAQPLFVRCHGPFPRHTKDSLYEKITEEYDKYFGEGNDLDVHFLRHYFTTHHRDSMGDIYCRYFRGDKSGGEAINAYTHAEWTNLREVYTSNIYQLGVSPSVPTHS